MTEPNFVDTDEWEWRKGRQNDPVPPDTDFVFFAQTNDAIWWRRKKGFLIGERVKRISSDYEFEGIVVSRFYKWRSKKRRYVVEDDRGLLFILSDHNLEKVT